MEVSHDEVVIGGIRVHIYGQGQLDSELDKVFVLYLAHGRLGTYKRVEYLATRSIECNRHKPLIAVSFDMRNHGERIVDPRANEEWNAGNASHGQDMLSTIDGSVLDFTLVMDYLPMYVKFRARKFESIIGGTSLGGHISWRLAARHNVAGMISIIGSPYLEPLLLERLDRYRDGLGKEQLKGQNLWPAQLSGALSAGDEATKQLDNTLKVAILVGKQDQLVPPKYCNMWRDGDRRDGSGERSVEYFEDDCGHECSLRMVEYTAEVVGRWIDQWSVGQSGLNG